VDNPRALVVLRLSEATIAVRRREGGARTALAAPGDAAVVRPGDFIVRRLLPPLLSPPPPLTTTHSEQ
jgi:hypothetical protein